MLLNSNEFYRRRSEKVLRERLKDNDSISERASKVWLPSTFEFESVLEILVQGYIYVHGKRS